MRSPWRASTWVIGALAVSGAAAQGTAPAAESGLGAQPDLSRTAPPALLDDPWSSPEIAAPHMGADVVKRPQSFKLTDTGGESPRRTRSWLRTTASLAGVVALIVLLAWGYRLVAGAGRSLSLSRRARHPGLIELISRTNLAPRQSLYLVRIGPQLILVGATHDSLRALSVVNDPDLAARLAGQQARQRADSHLAEFHQCLKTEARTYDEHADRRPAGAPDGVRIIDLKQKLANTVQRLRTTTQQT